MIVERDVALSGRTEDGQATLDLPITRLGNIEDSADVKETPEDADYFPIADNKTGKLKKTPWSKLKALFAGKEHTHAAKDITGMMELPTVPAESTDGVAYTAAVDGLTEYKSGMMLTVVPNMTSTQGGVTLDVNGLGAKGIRRPGKATSNQITADTANWLTANKSVLLQYNGTYWIAVAYGRPYASDLSGTVPAKNGGTGRNSMTANALICGNGTDAVNLVTAPEKSGFLYDSGGALPEWKTPEQVRSLTGAAGRVVWSNITVNTSAWAASGSYFAATVSVSGMLDTDNPHSVDIMRTADLAADEVCEAAFALVKRITTANGSITLYAKEKPGSNFNIWMEGTR